MARSDPATYAQIWRADRFLKKTRHGLDEDDVLDALAAAGLMLVEDDGTNVARHAWNVLQQRAREAGGC